MAGEILVLVTCPQSESENLARTLVQERLAACVNIIDKVRSIYMWEGKLADEPETLLIIKTHRSLWSELRIRLHVLHSYDVPEIISIPIEQGHQPYLDWLNASVRVTAGEN